jgi:starch phosphorylase
MLYRLGYFTQTIDCDGNQIAHYHPTHFSDLPLVHATDTDGNHVQVEVELPGRRVALRVWEARAGHIRLFLLDSDLEINSADDQSITYQLYGGDKKMRILQEIVLGIGGVRTLAALGLSPTVWHINEGHAAFQILERCRQCVREGMGFDAALERVAAATVFTTHTPVAAGHDIFDHDLMREHFGDFVSELNMDMDEFLSLGSSPSNSGGFNQTALALRGSRFHNGVSRIHGEVASRMEGYVWPQIPAAENPIRHVTNGVHLQTFLADEWINLLTMRHGGEWRTQLLNPEFWNVIHDVPDHSFWSVHQSLKSELFTLLKQIVTSQTQRNGYSSARTNRMTRFIEPETTDILTIGFARRFATYKRAALLFSDPERLARILNDAECPVVLIFAGKAHPKDLPGQQLIKTIHEYSQRPEFEGRIILAEGYDMALARRLVSGVDVWLNTPEYPMEASGTSGEKAGINGVLNLSVLDGWWGEGYQGDNGWAIVPHAPNTDPEYRDREEANELLSLLEHEIVPTYYDRNHRGYSSKWVRLSKTSMATLIPRFNAQRMVMDYVRDFYAPAAKQGRVLGTDNGVSATELSEWKKKILSNWSNVSLTSLDDPPKCIRAGEHLTIRVAAALGSLEVDDITVECLVGTESEGRDFETVVRLELNACGNTDDGRVIFELALDPPMAGLQFYKIRAYPTHANLCHPFETGCMIWL